MPVPTEQELDEAAIANAPVTMEPVPDVILDGLARLISEYRDAPRVKGTIAAFLDPVQDLEEAMAALYDRALSIDDATGAQLDLIGDLLGEPRTGRSDATYRRSLRVLILVLRSDGTVADLLRVALTWAGLLGETRAVDVTAFAPMALEVDVYRDFVDPAGLYVRLHRAKGAGERLELVYVADGEAGSLLMASLDPEAYALASDPRDLMATVHGSGGPEGAGVMSSVIGDLDAALAHVVPDAEYYIEGILTDPDGALILLG